MQNFRIIIVLIIFLTNNAFSQSGRKSDKLSGIYSFIDTASNKPHYIVIKQQGSSITGHYIGVTVENGDTLYYVSKIEDFKNNEGGFSFQCSEINVTDIAISDITIFPDIDTIKQEQIIVKHFVEKNMLPFFLGYHFTGHSTNTGLFLVRFPLMVDSAGENIFFKRNVKQIN